MSKKYTKEFLIEEFWRFYKEYGRYPRGKDIKGSLGFPSEDAYKTKWGTFNTFLYDIGIMGDNGWYKHDEQILINLYENGKQEEILNKLMIKRNWEAVKVKANNMGLFRSKEAKYGARTFSKDFLIGELHRFYNENKRTPLIIDFENNKNYPSVKVYQDKFSSWNNALKEAGLEVNINRDYTKEDLINEAIKFYNIHNRSPKNNELKYCRSTISRYWDSWNDFLDECKLQKYKNRNGFKTKEEAIIFIQELSKKINKIPNSYDVIRNSNISRECFWNLFGTWDNLLLESGLISKEDIINKDQRIKNSINGLINLYDILGKCPTVNEYDKYAKKNKLISRRILEKYLNISYNDICMKYIGDANNYSKSNEQLLDELTQLKNKLGRTPYSFELTPKNNMPSLSQYMNAFNMTYNQLVKSLGWELSGHEFPLKNDNELLNDLYFLYLELGRLPLANEINQDKSMASYKCYVNRFGSMQYVYKRLNIDYYNNTSGRLSYDKLGRLCRSTPERDISNYLIKKDIDHEKEYSYSKILNCIHDNRRCDWIIHNNNKIFYVEYFGFWVNGNSKIVINYKKKARKKIKNLYKAELIEQCIFIFPKDLKNKSLDEIFNKFLNNKVA